MEVSFAFLCDYADNSGVKMSAIGIGVDTIYAVKIPAKHPLIYCVIGIKFSITEVGKKRVGMRLIDSDGKDIVPPMDQTINVNSPPKGFLYKTQRIVLALYGVVFPNYGDYAISWLLDGQEIKSVSLKVATPPNPTGTV